MLVDIRRLTVEEYHRLGEMGIIDPDEKVELIEGQIIKKPVKGTPHSAAVARTDNLLRNRLGEQVLVRLQDPVRLDDYSEPEADIAVVMPDPLYYEDHHPTPREVYLIIEVADTTLRSDRELKAKVYAKSGIADYWVLDVNNRQLYVFREPSPKGYQSQVILKDHANISLWAFPEVALAVSASTEAIKYESGN
ncbi:MAG: Uma2 family endonuclease [Hormoscilla sp. SP5CHS1]|nr:Uma2 family endonuclease [Hormoscilla sp. SP12CHS1]MBC6455603.1 Uma2 family endonuclease [Hormoscilla sp. SP5CHS1]